MKKLLTSFLLVVVMLGMSQQVFPQYKPQLSDFGKMWPLEFAPKASFSSTYDFNATDEWLDHIRMSSLQFASWCSASFISSDGLILTNHHCSRMVLDQVMKDGEDFDANGFYAGTMAEERKAPGLFVRQLVKIRDISDQVVKAVSAARNDQEMMSLRDSVMDAAIKETSAMEGWDGLEIEPVLYYSGLKVSLYGYKRYNDIRLVLIPELQLAFFGGDPDNFTYPRYNLDFTLWRAYEDGKPVNSTDFHFPFNDDGIRENEPIFVVGHPGNTERYRTMAQYVYDRDYRYQVQLDWLKNLMKELEAEYERSGDRGVQEQMFMLANSEKAIQGIVDGLHDKKLMDRKQQMEDYIRKAALAKGSEDYWTELAAEYSKLGNEIMEVTLLNPQSRYSTAMSMAFALDAYKDMLSEGSDDTASQAEFKGMFGGAASALTEPTEQKHLAALLTFMQRYADEDDDYVATLLGGQTPEQAAKRILSETLFSDQKKVDKFLKWNEKKVEKSDDPLLEMSRLIVPEYVKSSQIMASNVATRRALENKIAREMFGVFGTELPPDATFTLRISDGRVKGYEYNGTEAPYQTTYFGLYDRYYSFNGKFPWGLPDRWLKPDMELLKAPLDFVSTVDIIGGNSGSPMINKHGELIGLVFDGNIESLPGNFIFDEEYNRAVGVHAGAIAAALRLVYGADRILEELGVK